MEKIDPNSPELKGKLFQLNESGTEFMYPPRSEEITDPTDLNDDAATLACAADGCKRKVKVSDEGNVDYAWYYLTNNSDSDATVTIERRWIYEGRWRKDTAQHRLYPGEHREVFSFPRNQNPMCCITVCALA